MRRWAPSSPALDRICVVHRTRRGEGAELLVDGHALKVPGCEGGFWLGGTLFDHVTPGHGIYDDEIFGPGSLGGAGQRR
jgi:malonate-semialdehyde dehydrogenase (acetylating)/methylmalonate-semialdehyde dehydrogenase